tara:strand:- start:2166 stop:5282 length:3117 start_codon:yes stop_codon:yes gene_type:complete
MVRKLVVVFTSVVLFAAAHAKALGLGEIVLDSALNQPLNAQIALLQLGDVRPEQISVQIADESDFARFSIERESFLNSIEFNVQSRGANTFVQLSTLEAVREPYLSFVLETRWPSGRLLSEHTLLLDLPAFAASGSAAPIQQPVQAVPAVQQISQNQQVTTQSSSASAAAPARLAAPAEPEPAEPEELAAPTPVAEIAIEPPAPAVVPEPAPAPSATPRNANASETVSIGTQDTLWDIALQIRPDSSVSVQQTMLALQSLNREAFISDNINMVRRGQVLRVPTLEQIRTLSAREAMSEVARQNQLFDNRRNVPLAAQPVTAQPQSTAATEPGRGELSVVSVDNAEPSDASTASASQSAELDARIASLEDALAVQREEADRAARVNAELVARLGLLEEQINSAQEIIRLRDLELAQLQQALEAAAAEPAPVDPPTVITMAPEKTLVQQILDTLVANTYALIALIGLIIVMLVFVLLRRNRAADQAALAGIDGIEVEAGDAGAGAQSDDDTEIPDGDSSISADLSKDELDEILDIAGSADAALLSEDIKFDDEEAADSDDDLEELDPDEVAAALATDAERAETQKPHPPVDILEEAEALIVYERFDAAETMLRDAIVAEPDRVDLRMKLLEVFVAKQDAVGFKLQETEIRDMGKPNVEARIATLRSQLVNEIDSEILEEGEEDFFEELNELDDMELALDLEASAEVDDSKVLAGSPEDEIDISFDDPEEEAGDFEFAVDEDEEGSTATDKADEAIELGFASPEPGEIVEDFDESAEASAELDAAFDLSDDDEETISFEIEDSAPASAAAKPEPAELEVDDNAIDFEFTMDDEEVAADTAQPEATSVEVESDPEHEVDFDFAVMDDESEQDDKAETSPAAATAAPEMEVEEVELLEEEAPENELPEIEFEFDDEDAEIEFLDDEEEEADFVFDAKSSELDDDEELPQEPEAKPAATQEEGPFDDLQFVDESIEPAHDDDESSEDDDFDFLSDADEAATKLDLARAYFEMGDHDGAREILEEVQKEGNEEQIKDATELLSKL